MASIPSFLIKSNLPISGNHWGLEFKAGVAVTDDVALANKLIRKGYAVTCVAEPEKTPPPEPLPGPEGPENTEPEQPAEPPAPTEPARKAAATRARKSATAKKG